MAKNIVAAGLAKRCQIQVSYAIGIAKPTSVMVTTFRYRRHQRRASLQCWCSEHFDLRPKGIVQMLDLLRPIYQKSAAYGHFGREEPEAHGSVPTRPRLRASAGLETPNGCASLSLRRWCCLRPDWPGFVSSGLFRSRLNRSRRSLRAHAEKAAAANPAPAIAPALGSATKEWCRRLIVRLPDVSQATCESVALHPTGALSLQGFPILARRIEAIKNGRPIRTQYAFCCWAAYISRNDHGVELVRGAQIDLGGKRHA